MYCEFLSAALVGVILTPLREEAGLRYSIQMLKLEGCSTIPNFLIPLKWMLHATFYEKFYMYMTKETFTAMTRGTPDNFQFSIKVPETVTHDKRLDVTKGAMALLDEFLDKISPLKSANKLGAVLIQLPAKFYR